MVNCDGKLKFKRLSCLGNEEHNLCYLNVLGMVFDMARKCVGQISWRKDKFCGI